MKRANADIDNKVLAGLIVGALTYALTKLAIPVDPQMEQLINVSAALLAAYLVPSKLPAALTAEADEADDVPEPPGSIETGYVRDELVAYAHAEPAAYVYAEPALDPHADIRVYAQPSGPGTNGQATATLTQRHAVEEVDELDYDALGDEDEHEGDDGASATPPEPS